MKTQEFDFEGYRVWRADNWDRPLGTLGRRTGPPADLWKLLFEADVRNDFGETPASTGFATSRSTHSPRARPSRRT